LSRQGKGGISKSETPPGNRTNVLKNDEHNGVEKKKEKNTSEQKVKATNKRGENTGLYWKTTLERENVHGIELEKKLQRGQGRVEKRISSQSSPKKENACRGNFDTHLGREGDE